MLWITWLFPWIVGIFGLIVGSFLNVVTLRFEMGKTLGGRSVCPSCDNQLKWYELFPVVSFLVQRGKCRNCAAAISWQYPLVEFSTAVLFFFSAQYAAMNGYLSGWWIVGFLAIIAMMSFIILIITHDLRTQEIPVVWLIGLLVSGIVFLLIQSAGNQYIWLGDLVFQAAGLVITIPFLVLWMISRGRWMGFGDIEIIAWMGLMLGIVPGLTALLGAFYAGGLFGIGYIIIQKMYGKKYQDIRKTRIPFAPFLLVSFAVVFFANSLISRLLNYFLL